MTLRVQEIEQLRMAYRESIARAFDAACAIDEPAGTSEAWHNVCQESGVQSLSEAERQQIRSVQRPTRGAPVMELRGVVLGICRTVRPKLNRLDCTLGTADEKIAWNRFYRLIDRAEHELVNLYKRHVLPPVSGGLFANVLAHAGRAPKPAGGSANLMRCRHCGAPRMNDDNEFICEFCDNHMFKEIVWE